jgi:hypothetical protein
MGKPQENRAFGSLQLTKCGRQIILFLLLTCLVSNRTFADCLFHNEKFTLMKDAGGSTEMPTITIVPNITPNGATVSGGTPPTDGGFWNSGAYPWQWIEFNWNDAVTIEAVVLTVSQLPNCDANNTITYLGPKPTPEAKRTTIAQLDFNSLFNGQVILINGSVSGVFGVRITTTQSQSWVAWNSIQIFGTNVPSDLTQC